MFVSSFGGPFTFSFTIQLTESKAFESTPFWQPLIMDSNAINDAAYRGVCIRHSTDRESCI
jgi:hypothetical protein